MRIFSSIFSFKLVTTIFVFILVGTATAEEYLQDEGASVVSRKDFIKKCNESFSDPIKVPKHASKELLRLIKDLDTETDPEKRKILEDNKKVEMEKYLEKIDKLCNKLSESMFK